MTSIRRHLTVRLLIGTFAVAALVLAAVFAYLRHELYEQFDVALLSRARMLGSLVRVDDERGVIEFEMTQRSAAEYGQGRTPDYFEIWEQDGKVLARSGGLAASANLPRDPHPQPSDAPARFFDLTLPDGRQGRAVEFLVEPSEEDEQSTSTAAPQKQVQPGPPVTLVLAADVSELDDATLKVLVSLLAVFGAYAGATVWTVVASVRRGLRPLTEIGDAVARVDPETLDSRFDVAGLSDELRPIGQKLNELLARLDDAFRRERRFTSNVAHELRTPIAELRSLAEVALRWPGDAESAGRNFSDVLGIAQQMEAVVAALLSIARSQAGHESLSLGAVQVTDAVTDTWRPHAAKARSHNLDATFDVRPAMLRSDRTVLSVMLGNLFGNAVSYTPAGGRIECVGRMDGNARYVLEIANTNESITDADLQLLSEPFWRKDASRANTSTNSGLGLALVATYAKLLHAQFTLSLRKPSLFVATLIIPLEEDAPAAAPKQSETRREPAAALT